MTNVTCSLQHVIGYGVFWLVWGEFTFPLTFLTLTPKYLVDRHLHTIITPPQHVLDQKFYYASLYYCTAKT